MVSTVRARPPPGLRSLLVGASAARLGLQMRPQQQQQLMQQQLQQQLRQQMQLLRAGMEYGGLRTLVKKGGGVRRGQRVRPLLRPHLEFALALVPRDAGLKSKYLRHHTGHLFFPRQCSAHYYRLYHTSRDCTTPAYYRRCARLLSRLAASPVCRA
ncbi:ALK and LTK ligand 2-like [Lethenteron reissneri]|uniref:ALK and LTK ligand 2-like n=1 Tax=Lethenteron reissneri TaxID=7753 RepID=UPI002AB730DA|nr:ALK and LTK ligand 2-like [Lethenteron reissneri]